MKFAVYELWEEERRMLEEMSKKYGFTYVATKEVLSFDNMHLCDGCEGVSTLGSVRMDDGLFRALAEQGVRYYCTRTIGYNHVDLAAAKKYGVKVCNSNYPPDSVAEFTVMMILLSLRKYKQTLWRQQVNDYSLRGLQGRVLGRMTVGVIGGGRIGTKVMELLRGFGCRLLCYSNDRRAEVEEYAEYVDEDTMYALSDIITYHIPLSESTRHILNDRSLKKMKEGVILINTARGELFDIQTLISGIESQKIGALAMDVFEGEEGIYHENRLVDILRNRDMAYLRQFPNVIFTPHMAFYTRLSMESMMQTGMENLVQFCRTGTATQEIKG